MSDMDDTRKDLADKLEKLEKKVTDTVSTDTDLVEKVPETVETVKETVAETVSTVTGTVQHTVEAVKDTVEGTVDAVKGTVASTVGAVRNFFDIPHQVDRHPWLMMGGSVLLGFLGGRLLLPRRHAAEPESRSTAFEPTPAYAPSYAREATAPEAYAAAHAPERTEKEPSGPSWISRLTERFGGEIDKVKGLAIGTLMGAVRDAASSWAPETLRNDVTEVINNFTRDMGGKVFEGPVLGGDQGGAQAAQEPPQRQEAEEPAAGAYRGTATRMSGQSRR
jgi:hypothetical protein